MAGMAYYSIESLYHALCIMNACLHGHHCTICERELWELFYSKSISYSYTCYNPIHSYTCSYTINFDLKISPLKLPQLTTYFNSA